MVTCPECKGDKYTGQRYTPDGLDDVACPRCKGAGEVAAMFPWEIKELLQQGIIVRKDGSLQPLRYMTLKEIRDLYTAHAIKRVREWIRAVDGLNVHVYPMKDGKGVAALVRGQEETFPWGVIPEADLDDTLVAIRNEFSRLNRTVVVRFGRGKNIILTATKLSRDLGFAKFEDPIYGTFYARERSDKLCWLPIRRSDSSQGYGI